MRKPSTVLLLTILLMGWTVSVQAQQSILQRLENANERQLQKLLPQYPAADANGDGVLTKQEAIAFVQRRARASSQKGAKPPILQPTLTDISYGPHERNRLDLWQASSNTSTPLVIFIHGGGFSAGDKSKWREDGNVKKLLDAGISCAAINYRFRKHAPIQDILHDAAHAVQFLRSKSDEWGLDKSRFAAWGGSAGAGTSLWLGSRDDLADPTHSDPVRRESSRVQAVVLHSTQATYDLTKWEAFLGPPNEAWWTSPSEPAEFYHLTSMEELKSQQSKSILQECDMLNWITPGDAPVFVSNKLPDSPPKNREHYLHHPSHAREIQKACLSSAVPCYWQQGPGSVEVQDPVQFVKSILLGP